MSGENTDLTKQKIELEITKLKQDTGIRGWASTGASILFGLATIAFSGMTYYANLEKSAQEIMKSCDDSAVAVSKVIDDARKAIANTENGKKADRAEEVMNAFSPQMALIIGRTLAEHIGKESGDYTMLMNHIGALSKKYPDASKCKSVALLER